MEKKPHETWKSYLNICKLGGSLSFINLLKQAGLQSPFDNNTILEIIEYSKNYLEQIDDFIL